MSDPFDDEEARLAWLEKWGPPCPIGNPMRLGQLVGYRERNIGELELRVVLAPGDEGVCQVIVDERDDEVYVRVLLCYDETADDVASRSTDYLDCPVRTWLERPLGGRAVIDVDSDEKLPLKVPRSVVNVDPDR